MYKKIGVLLFSAGLGSRISHRTLDNPKVLLLVNGNPILKHWLDKSIMLKPQKIIVNTHYLSEKIDEFINSEYKSNNKIITKYENELLGTGGSLKVYINEFENIETIIFIHTDNYSSINLADFIDTHSRRPKEANITMGIFKPTNHVGCGMLDFNEKGMVTYYEEKPLNTNLEWANAGIFAAEVNYILGLESLLPTISDFSKDFIPTHFKEFYTHQINDYHIDIGTEENYILANNIN